MNYVVIGLGLLVLGGYAIIWFLKLVIEIFSAGASVVAATGHAASSGARSTAQALRQYLRQRLHPRITQFIPNDIDECEQSIIATEASVTTATN